MTETTFPTFRYYLDAWRFTRERGLDMTAIRKRDSVTWEVVL